MSEEEIVVGRSYTDGSERREVLAIYRPISGVLAPPFVEYKIRGKDHVKHSTAYHTATLMDFARWAKQTTSPRNFFGKSYRPSQPTGEPK